MARRWNLGLVGCGRGSAYGHLACRDPRFEIIALCDSDPEALARHQPDLGLPDSRCWTSYESFIQASPKLDAVIIGTPIPAHADQAAMALQAGINVMSEVTAANTIEGCARIVEAARRSGKIYMLAENEIFRPVFGEWEKLVRAGELGEIIYAEADYLHPIPELLINLRTGEKLWRAERPPVHYCSHSLGPILYLTGDRIVRAMAIGDGHRLLPEAGVGGIDIQLAAFETERKMLIKMTRTQVAPRHPPIHYHHLQGTKGFVETDRRGPDPKRHIQQGLLYVHGQMDQARVMEWPELEARAPEWATLGGHGTADYSTFLQFAEALEGGRKPALDQVRAWDLTVPGLVAWESAQRGGAWLEVPPPPG